MDNLQTIEPNLSPSSSTLHSQIESNITTLYSTSPHSSQSLSSSNDFLTSFIQLHHFPELKSLLNTSQSIQTKYYAAHSLLTLITSHYLSIPPTEINDLYSSLISYLFANCDYLSTASTLFLKRILIQLLTRIIRINWLYSSTVKNIYHDVVSNAKEDQVNSLMLPFAIFSELITQFQTYNLPPRHKMKKAIVDFKESALLSIFDYSMQELCSLFHHQIKTEKTEDLFFFIDEVIKCLRECLEYDEDINAKEDYYSRYEIKPVYIPNNKKRMRDKTLDIELLESLVQNLFDNNNLMIKAKGSNAKDNQSSSQCLILLQKLLAMKIVYLGDKRMHLLKIFQDGICNILFNGNGIVNHEQLCKLIYCCRKNYTVSDLVQNENFINYICMFTQDTLKENFIEGINGFIYLLRYFSYLSFGIERMSYIAKITIKGFLVTLLSNILMKSSQVLKEFSTNATISEDQLNDLIKAFGLCGYCCYEEMLNILNDNINQTQELQLNTLCIRYGVSLMKAKYELFSDAKLLNKTTEHDLMIDSIHLTELVPNEITNSVTFMLKSFGLLQAQADYYKTLNAGYDYQLNLSLLSFLKFFSRYFLSQHLPNKFHHFFQQIMQQLNLPSIGEIVSYVIDALIPLCQQGTIEMRKTIRIIRIIEGNAMSEGGNKVYVGKVQLTMDFVPHLQELIALIVKVDPIQRRKLRIVLLSSLFNLYALTISYENALGQFLLQFSFEMISSDLRQLDYAVNSLSALIRSIKKRNEYELFIESILSLLQVITSSYVKIEEINESMVNILKLFKELTFNSYSRISFKNNSDCPYKLFKMTMDLVMHFYAISRKSHAFGESNKESERYLMKIKPISLIVRLLSNIFKGEFMQMSLIVNAETIIIKDLFKAVMEMITGLSYQDFFAYSTKMKGVYDIFKVIYADYGRCAEVNESIIAFILKLVNEGLQSNQLDMTSSICALVFAFGKDYAALKLGMGQHHQLHSETRAILQIVFERKGKEMQEILIKMLKMVIDDNQTDQAIASNTVIIDALSKPILLLGMIYREEYKSIIASTGGSSVIDIAKFTNGDKGIINDLLINLYDRTTINDYVMNSSKNHEVFLNDLKQLIIKLNETFDNHQYYHNHNNNKPSTSPSDMTNE